MLYNFSAIETKNEELIGLFFQDNLYNTIQWNIQNYSNNTAPLLALRYGNLTTIENMVKLETTDFNMQDENTHSGPMIAVMRDEPYILEKLKSRNDINWNMKDKYHCTTVILAIKSNAIKCLSILTKIEKINWNQGDINGNTPAILAVKANSTNAFHMLLDITSIDWNICNKENDSPLTIIIQSNKIEYFKYLFERNKIIPNIYLLRRKNLLKLATTITRQIIRQTMNDYGIEHQENGKALIAEILFTLEKNLNAAIINILVSELDTYDVLDLVIYWSNNKTNENIKIIK